MGKSKLDKVILSAQKEAYSNTHLPSSLNGKVEIKFSSNGVHLGLIKSKKSTKVKR